ncbi:MAG: hypothetical protein ACRC35_12755 [Angustibacter sp.]
MRGRSTGGGTRDERGAATAEYAGILVVVALLVLALLAAATSMGHAILATICQAWGIRCGASFTDQRARQLAIPCVLGRTDRVLGYDVTVRYLRIERQDTDQVRVNADGSATVVLTQGSRGGLAADVGPKVSATARLTSGADLGYVYNFPTALGGEQAARDFLDSRRGIAQEAVDIVVPGAQTLRQGAYQAGHWARERWDGLRGLVGMSPPQEEIAARERSQARGTPDAIQAVVRLQGAVGVSLDASAARLAGRASLTITGTATTSVNQQGPDRASSTFTGAVRLDASADVTAGAIGEVRAGGLPPIFSIGAVYGRSAEYTVVFDDRGAPLRLVLSQESRFALGAGLDVKAGRPTGSGRDVKAGARSSVRGGDLTLRTTTLDLTVPDNRAAFDRFFVVRQMDAGGFLARTVGIQLGGGLSAIGRRWSAVQERLDADGFDARYEYRTAGDATAASAGRPPSAGARSGGVGFGGERTEDGRKLLGAVARDNRIGGGEISLATCER